MSDKASCSRPPAESPHGSEWESDFEDDDELYEDLNPGKRTTLTKTLIREALQQYRMVQTSWINMAMRDCNIERPIMDIMELLDDVTRDFKSAKIAESEEARKYRPSNKKHTLADVATIVHVPKQTSSPLTSISESPTRKSFKDILQKPANTPGTPVALQSSKEFLDVRHACACKPRIL